MNQILKERFPKVLKSALVWNTVIGISLRGIGDAFQQTIERKAKRACEPSSTLRFNWIRIRIFFNTKN